MRVRLSCILALASLLPGCFEDTPASTSGGSTDSGSGGSTTGGTSAGTSGGTATATGTSGTTGGGEVCGDGLITGVEGCDDGPGQNGPGKTCNADCQPNVCGDGDKSPNEDCDMGAGNVDTGGCKSNCTLQTCGDGFTGPGEGCDDGNMVDDDACSNACALATCGNGTMDPEEACDDGNMVDDDACSNVCTAAVCGDGILQGATGEECDEGGANSDQSACTASCKTAECGDGLVLAGTEECDDGANNGAGKQCKADCALNVCGDNDVGPNEGCDDGNLTGGDGCSASCISESCGNGTQEGMEECDDGNMNNTDGCTTLCKLPACGDGYEQTGAGESCDNGQNNSNQSACTSECQDAACGDGFVYSGVEECDGGPNCTPMCKVNVCGDDFQGPGEECDDGNGMNGDGCNNNCTLPGCGNQVDDGTEICLAPQPPMMGLNNPHGLVAADFNDDGHQDLAVVQRAANQLWVVLGNGDGSFGVPKTYATCGTPRSVAAGPLKNSVLPDLAVACEINPGTIRMFENLGDGTFQMLADVTGGNNMYDVLIADLDADGDGDLMGSTRSTDNSWVWEGKAGTGPSGAGTSYASGDGYTLILGQFGGDSHLDVVAGNFDTDQYRLLTNTSANGTVSFTVGNAVGTCDGPTFGTRGNINGDNVTDFGLPCYYTDNFDVERGGNGAFTSVGLYVVGDTPPAAVFFDGDKDGFDDYAVLGNMPNTVKVRRNDGTGVFGAEQTLMLPGAPARIIKADFDGNGYDDLAVTMAGMMLHNSPVQVFLNKP